MIGTPIIGITVPLICPKITNLAKFKFLLQHLIFNDFMDTHQYISECLTNLVFFQIARKRDISWRDLNRDLNLNLKRTVGALKKKNAQKFVLIKKPKDSVSKNIWFKIEWNINNYKKKCWTTKHKQYRKINCKWQLTSSASGIWRTFQIVRHCN